MGYTEYEGQKPDENEVALVMELTKDAYARSGQPTRDPRAPWSYWPDDEWETAVRFLLAAPDLLLAEDEPMPTQRCTVRQAAALLLSKAARHAADGERLLGPYVYGNRDKYIEMDDPFVSDEDVHNAQVGAGPTACPNCGERSYGGCFACHMTDLITGAH